MPTPALSKCSTPPRRGPQPTCSWKQPVYKPPRPLSLIWEVLGDFATIYALSCGEKLSPKSTFVEKKWQIWGLLSPQVEHNLSFLGSTRPHQRLMRPPIMDLPSNTTRFHNNNTDPSHCHIFHFWIPRMFQFWMFLFLTILFLILYWSYLCLLLMDLFFTARLPLEELLEEKIVIFV